MKTHNLTEEEKILIKAAAKLRKTAHIARISEHNFVLKQLGLAVQQGPVGEAHRATCAARSEARDACQKDIHELDIALKAIQKQIDARRAKLDEDLIPLNRACETTAWAMTNALSEAMEEANSRFSDLKGLAAKSPGNWKPLDEFIDQVKVAKRLDEMGPG